MCCVLRLWLVCVLVLERCALLVSCCLFNVLIDCLLLLGVVVRYRPLLVCVGYCVVFSVGCRVWSCVVVCCGLYFFVCCCLLVFVVACCVACVDCCVLRIDDAVVVYVCLSRVVRRRFLFAGCCLLLCVCLLFVLFVLLVDG